VAPLSCALYEEEEFPKGGMRQHPGEEDQGSVPLWGECRLSPKGSSIPSELLSRRRRIRTRDAENKKRLRSVSHRVLSDGMTRRSEEDDGEEASRVLIFALLLAMT